MILLDYLLIDLLGSIEASRLSSVTEGDIATNLFQTELILWINGTDMSWQRENSTPSEVRSVRKSRYSGEQIGQALRRGRHRKRQPEAEGGGARRAENRPQGASN